MILVFAKAGGIKIGVGRGDKTAFFGEDFNDTFIFIEAVQTVVGQFFVSCREDEEVIFRDYSQRVYLDGAEFIK